MSVVSVPNVVSRWAIELKVFGIEIEERGSARSISQIRIAVIREQRIDDGIVVPLHGEHERGLAFFILQIRFRSERDQIHHKLNAARVGREMQRRIAHAIADIRIGAFAQQLYHRGGSRFPRCKNERGLMIFLAR